MSVSEMKAAFFPGGVYAGFQATRSADETGFLSDADVLGEIVGAVRPKTIIEVGSWKGHSAIAMAKACKGLGLATDIVCVDTWLGSSEHWLRGRYRGELRIVNGRPRLYDEFLSNVILSGCQEIITPLSLPSATASIVLKHFNIRADMIYIDGAHEYDDVLGDISNYVGLVGSGGVIFGDDYQYEPLRRAVHDFARKNAAKVHVKGRKWLYAGAQSASLGIGELKIA